MGRGILTDLAIRISADAAELKSGLRDVNRKMSKFDKGLSTAAKLLPAAFATGVVVEWAGAAAKASLELLEMKDNIRRFVKDAGDIDIITGKVAAMARVFDTDVNKVLEASNVLVKRMGVSWNESLEMIEKGLALSGSSRQEFLEQLREYSPFFKEAKADAEALFGVIIRGFEGGVFNDKAADAIKEGVLSLREMTNATKDALKALGFDAEKITSNIEKGTLSIWEALQRISERMAELPPDSKAVGQAMADIFKGAGEDAGYAFLTSFHKEFSIKEAIAGNELAQAKIKLQDEAAKIATIWSHTLGKDSTWWTEFKADVTGLASEVIKAAGTAILGFDWRNKIDNLELIDKEQTVEGLQSILNDIQSKIIETKEKLDRKVGVSILGKTIFGRPEEERKRLNDELKYYSDQYEFYRQKIQKLSQQKVTAPDTPAKKTIVDIGIEPEKINLDEVFANELERIDVTWADMFAKYKFYEPKFKFPVNFDDLGNIMTYWEIMNQKMQSTMQIANSLQNMFSILGSGIDTLASKETNAAQKIGATAATISGLISQYLALMAAKEGAANAAKGFPLSVILTAAGIAGLMSVISPFLQRRATGGPISGLTLVGERGPELFDGSGYIYNTQRTRQLLGGGSGGAVEFRIHGDELVGILDRYAKKTSEFG